MQIRVKPLAGNEEVFRDFRQMQRNLRDPRRALQKAGDYYLKTIQTRHDRESYQMAPWPPLSPDYKKQKDKVYAGRKILERTGRMRRSYFYEVKGNELLISNRTPYWQYHEHLPQNESRDRGVMPVRKTTEPTQYNLDKMAAIAAAELTPARVSKPRVRGFGRRDG